DMQANPIAIFSDTLTLLYANTSLNNLLDSHDSVATVELFNSLFRGVKKIIKTCITENTAKTLNKVVKDSKSEQLIPYKLKIIPVSHNKICRGVFVIVETDISRLVNYFNEEKMALSKRVSDLTLKNKNTIKFVNTLFDNSPVGMMVLDNNKRIVQINESGTSILGLDNKNTIGLPVSRFYTDTTLNEKSDINTPREIHVVTWKDEEKILLHCSVESIDEEGQPFTIDTFIDISSIENARLAAEQSNKSKTEFLANMSHELRTPLHTIMGFSECGLELGKELNTDKAEEYFNKIHHGGEVLLALVNNLLDIAKLETGKISFDFKNVQFDKLVEDVIKEFDVIAESKNVKITCDIKNKINPMAMDEMRMQQVVRNLLTNAVKFTAVDTEIVVTIEQRIDYIQLRIYDHGPGIPVDELENIFDKFIQSTLTNSGAGGTGLGLSICREILYQHNGIIWAENNPQGGAVFVVNKYQGYQVVS
ncbi:MAG: PAS domain-containing sensor histidine kinase, partial [Gammaproteobacteria bacterium]|nr:PAS domain-containing sensor histidine kinase [Gammaproteobacteria bacterium]